MNLKLKHFLVGFFSFLLFFATLFIPVKVENINQIKNVKFGFPLPFISQDFSNDDSFNFFPCYYKFEIKKIKEVNNFSIVNFFLSFISIFFVLEIIIWFLETIDFKIRNYFGKKE